ncbi:MAG TPA: PEP-CTERM sorting domain-containing protein [Verrucomicrobiales bacterium]|jgi:hypothetical protein|nr:PEP-CTERM sorting domain-containing protein [Verrucomicrobiales bacterium]
MFAAFLVPAFVALAAPARSAVILAVDFTLPGGLVEPGFQGFFVANAINGTVSSTFGANTVTLLAGTQAHNPDGTAGRDRANPLDSASFTYGDLMRDLVTRFDSGGNGQPPRTSFTISGLQPNGLYTFQVFSLDYPNNNNSVSTWYDMTPAVPFAIGSITNLTNTIPTSNDQFSTTGPIVADAAGMVNIGSTFTAGAGQLNGFILSDRVPEPGSAALTVVAAIAMMRRRRKG